MLFVASLLAHEMAHAIVAQHNGVEVDGITLWLLGGVARLRGEAPTPGADFRISVIGPVTSLVVAGVFGAAAWLAELADLNGLVVAVPSYLAAINVVLAVFNTIPAAPLDGGRILRAAVWAWRGDRLTATVVAARAGRIFGFTLIALGLLLAIGGTGSGLWWMLLGLFIVTMASAEEHHARTSTALAGIKVRDVMTEHPETADGDSTITEFLRDTALLRRHSAFPLLDQAGQLQGLVTLNRIRAVPPSGGQARCCAKWPAPQTRSRGLSPTNRSRRCFPGSEDAPTVVPWSSAMVTWLASSRPATSAARRHCMV